jgi:cytidylate kinase
MESRIKRIMSLNPGLSRDEAVNSIEIVDRRRKAYHEYYSPIEWGKMDAYDICVNSGLIGVDGCLDAALAYIGHVR